MLLSHYLLVLFVSQKEIYTMSKKNLLSESTIRKFMKLASIEPLASDFLGRIQEVEEDVEEGMRPEMKADDEDMDEGKHDDDLEEGRDKEEMDEAAHEDDEKMEEDVDLEERGDMMFKDDEDDMDMDMDMGDEAGGKMVDVDAFIGALESALETAMGEPAEVEYEEEEEEMDMDMEEPMDDMGGEELGLDADSEEEEEEEDLAESIYKAVLQKLSSQKK
jgi:hypothetical protein